MVKQVRVPESESWGNEKTSKLVEAVKASLGEDFVVQEWGQHLRVKYTDSPAGAAEPNFDIYFRTREIEIYSPDIFGWGVRVANALESIGEGEYTVRGNYSTETAEVWKLEPGQVSLKRD